MKNVLRLGAYAAALVAGSAVADTATDNLKRAVLVEWMVSHCRNDQIPAATVGVASMTIQGADQGEVSAAREVIRKGVAENYRDAEDACAQIIASMK